MSTPPATTATVRWSPTSGSLHETVSESVPPVVAKPVYAEQVGGRFVLCVRRQFGQCGVFPFRCGAAGLGVGA